MPTRTRVFHAARHAVAVTASVAVLFGGLIAAFATNSGTGMLTALSPVFTSWPAVAILVFAAVLFGLVVVAKSVTRWGLAVRAVVAGYAGIVAGTSAHLLLWELMRGTPGAAGGLGLITFSLVGFTFLGGPVVLGGLAALLGPAAGARKRAPDAAVRASRTGLRRLGAGLFAGGLLVASGITMLSYVVATYQGVDYKCIVEGPWPSALPDAADPQLVNARFSLWPLGRECIWSGVDGPATLAGGDWVSTGLAGGAALLGAAGLGLLIAARRRPVAAPEVLDDRAR